MIAPAAPPIAAPATAPPTVPAVAAPTTPPAAAPSAAPVPPRSSCAVQAARLRAATPASIVFLIIDPTLMLQRLAPTGRNLGHNGQSRLRFRREPVQPN